MLASVRSLEEARIALAGEVDLIDLKEPGSGALGAVEQGTLEDVVAFVDGRKPVSATVGDLPCDAEIVCPLVRKTAAAGPDIIKVGLFGETGQFELLRALGQIEADGTRIVVVMFADRNPDFSLLEVMAQCGLTGVMLDTAGKGSISLRGHLADQQLQEFTDTGRALGLLTGLAGSLTVDDIEPLSRLEPHYLGFRGALCGGGRRQDALDPMALRCVRTRLPKASAISSNNLEILA